MISPALYWVMTADDFTLDINNPEEPKVLRSRQQSRPAGHLRGGIGTVQLPYREAHQQEETAQIRRDYRRAAHHLLCVGWIT